MDYACQWVCTYECDVCAERRHTRRCTRHKTDRTAKPTRGRAQTATVQPATNMVPGGRGCTRALSCRRHHAIAERRIAHAREARPYRTASPVARYDKGAREEGGRGSQWPPRLPIGEAHVDARRRASHWRLRASVPRQAAHDETTPPPRRQLIGSSREASRQWRRASAPRAPRQCAPPSRSAGGSALRGPCPLGHTA